MFTHLSSHCDREENAEIDKQDRCIYWDIEETVDIISYQSAYDLSGLFIAETYGNRVAVKPTSIALVADSQNWNSGKRRMKGLNSSSSCPFAFGDDAVGKPGAPSSTSCSARSCSIEGSNLGCKNARNRSGIAVKIHRVRTDASR